MAACQYWIRASRYAMRFYDWNLICFTQTNHEVLQKKKKKKKLAKKVCELISVCSRLQQTETCFLIGK